MGSENQKTNILVLNLHVYIAFTNHNLNTPASYGEHGAGRSRSFKEV
jgi:hypothetical protein